MTNWINLQWLQAHHRKAIDLRREAAEESMPPDQRFDYLRAARDDVVAALECWGKALTIAECCGPTMVGRFSPRD